MRTISFNSYVILDSLQFLNASLDTLAKDLASNPSHKYEILDQMGLYKKGEDDKKKLLLCKQTFPYEFVTSLEKLRRTKKKKALQKKTEH